MSTQVMEQIQVDLASVIAAGKERHFYFREVNQDTYKGNWVFTPIEYCNLNHDERKRVAVLDFYGIPVREFIRGHEVVEVQQIVLPRIQIPWKIIAGAAGAAVAAVLLVPLLMGIVIVLGAILMLFAITIIDPVTIAVIDVEGRPEGCWLEIMAYYEAPPFTVTIAPKEEAK